MRRLIGAASIVFVVALTLVISGFVPVRAEQERPTTAHHGDDDDSRGPGRGPDGKAIFRFDTFGDEQLWTGVLRMQELLATVVTEALDAFLESVPEVDDLARQVPVRAKG